MRKKVIFILVILSSLILAVTYTFSNSDKKLIGLALNLESLPESGINMVCSRDPGKDVGLHCNLEISAKHAESLLSGREFVARTDYSCGESNIEKAYVASTKEHRDGFVWVCVNNGKDSQKVFIDYILP